MGCGCGRQRWPILVVPGRLGSERSRWGAPPPGRRSQQVEPIPGCRGSSAATAGGNLGPSPSALRPTCK
eukprot:10131145-Alexandrium_andersonii.AAC.1